VRHAAVADEWTTEVNWHKPRAVLIVERAQVAKVVERFPVLRRQVAAHEQRQSSLQVLGEEAGAAQFGGVHLEHLSRGR
jgi:hypothetical protein